MKLCGKCNTTKDESNFYRDSSLKSGRMGKCKVCYGEWQKDRYYKNPEHYIEKTRQWGIKFPEKKKLQRKHQYEKSKEHDKAIHKQYLKNNNEKVVSQKILKRYGLTRAEYNQLVQSQNGLCAICNRPETSKHQSGAIKKLAIDHCHTTGKVRGLLCGACNRALGLFKENINSLLNSIKYLEKAK